MLRCKLSRRRFLQLGLCAGLPTAGVSGYARFIEPYNLEIVEHRLPLAHLPPTLVGKRLVHICDLHTGRVPDDYIVSSLKTVNDLQADLLILTGDITDCYYGIQLERTQRLLSKLKSPPLGVVCCLGNHDYGTNWRLGHVADELTARLQELDFTVLRNQVIDVEGLLVGGVDDLWAGRSRPDQVIQQLTPNQAAIMLAHNPDLVDDLAFFAYKGWTFSGHTHGGQVRLPFIGAPFLPVHNRRYVSGFIHTDHGGKLYVSNGIGYTQPIRFRVPPQITVFTLERTDV